MTTLGGVLPWVWFVIAGLAAVAGLLLLVVDYGHRTAHQRERRRWAALRGWRFVLSDPVLPDRWRHGVIAWGGAGLAKDLVIGSLFTPLGRRPVQIFDHEQGGKVTCVVVAVQRRLHLGDLVVELWLPDRPFPQEPDLAMLCPVGERFAFVSDAARARLLVTVELITASDGVGHDIPVVWLEQDWVLAAAPVTATPARLERLLRALDEIVEIVDQLDVGGTDTRSEPPRAGQPTALPKAAGPTRAAGPTKIAEPTKAAGPTKVPGPTKAGGPTKIAEPTKAAESTKADRPTKVAEPTKPAGPTKVTELTRAVKPTRVVKPTKSADPSNLD